MNCPQCGAPLNPGAKFCTSCGAKQQVEPVFAPAPEAAPAAPAYEAPTYEAPAPEPVPAAPAYEAPAYEAPAPEPVPAAPAYEAPTYEAPAYEAPAPETVAAAAFTAPAYEAPAPEPQFQQAPYQPQQFQQNPYQAPAPEPQFQQAPYQPQQFQQNPYQAPAPEPQFQQAPYQPQQFQQAPYQPYQEPVQEPKKKKGKAGLIIGIIAAVVAVAAVVIVLVNVLGKPKAAPVTVNLNDYVVVTVEGRSGNGEADATIDTERLKADFSESLVWTCKTKNQPTDQTVMDLLCDNVAVYLNTYYSISNGDVLEVEVCDYFSDYNEYLSDYYGNNAVIECSNFTYTVEGLEEATGFDPFEGAEVSITGSEGETYVTLTLRDDLEVMGSLWITTDDDLYSLHNGDVIHYYIEGYDESEEELLKSLYGYYPTVTTWEYTVEGLSHYGYITNFADIDETMLTDLGQAYDDWLTGVYAGQDFIDAGILLTGIENMGYYYWILKDGASDIDTNVLYVVMKANFTYKDTAGKDATLTAWNYARITDLYLETDGSVTFYEGSFDDFNIAPDATFVTECYDDIEWTCTGYLDKASLIADIKLEEDNFRILATNME